jgi:type II secretory pathway pseudopilin PulG
MKLRGQHGYAMVALLIGLGVMAIMLTVAMPVWKTAVQREREAELIFRGQQYVRAIELYQRKLPGAAPPNIDMLVDQKFLRKKYKDPITGEDFQVLSPNSPGAGLGGAQPPGGRGAAGPATLTGRSSGPGASPSVTARGPGGTITVGLQAGVAGVVSTSKASSLRLYNGRNHYNEWQFVHVPRAPAPGVGVPGAGAPGVAVPGQRGVPGFPQFGPGGRGRGDGRGRGTPPNVPPGGRMTSPDGRTINLPAPGGRGPQPVFPR